MWKILEEYWWLVNEDHPHVLPDNDYACGLDTHRSQIILLSIRDARNNERLYSRTRNLSLASLTPRPYLTTTLIPNTEYRYNGSCIIVSPHLTNTAVCISPARVMVGLITDLCRRFTEYRELHLLLDIRTLRSSPLDLHSWATREALGGGTRRGH